jgi:hypothetical protein
MKIFSKITLNNNDHLYIIRDGNATFKVTLIYNSISGNYMGITFEFWDDCTEWLFRNKALIDDLYPHPADGLKLHKYTEIQPCQQEQNFWGLTQSTTNINV